MILMNVTYLHSFSWSQNAVNSIAYNFMLSTNEQMLIHNCQLFHIF
jgi:hypothetical protein